MKKITIIIIFILFTQLSVGSLDYLGVDSKIENNDISSVTISLIFGEGTDTVELGIFGRCSEFSYSEDLDCSLTKLGAVTRIKCSITSDKKTGKVMFKTSDFIQATHNKFYFNSQFVFYDNITRITGLVTLPMGMVVANLSNSIYPTNGVTISNGRNIMIFWEMSDVSPMQPINFQVIYESTGKFVGIWQLLTVSGIVAFTTLTLVYRRIKKPEEIVLSVLDEYERKVLEVIKSAGGKIRQKKVVLATNFSKAKVSRVVKNLVNRGLIETERRGRTNILKLKRKLFGK